MPTTPGGGAAIASVWVCLSSRQAKPVSVNPVGLGARPGWVPGGKVVDGTIGPRSISVPALLHDVSTTVIAPIAPRGAPMTPCGTGAGLPCSVRGAATKPASPKLNTSTTVAEPSNDLAADARSGPRQSAAMVHASFASMPASASAGRTVAGNASMLHLVAPYCVVKVAGSKP